ncbi:MAG: hypothetical protein ACRC2J_08895 [Microcoleaceae cyanobacterium]
MIYVPTNTEKHIDLANCIKLFAITVDNLADVNLADKNLVNI